MHAAQSGALWLLLRGDDVKPRIPGVKPARVVLLHGWLQEHGVWLKTAAALRDLYGHSVLLLDFYGHGHSPTAPSPEDDSPAGYCALLSDRLNSLGWDQGQKLAMCGCSMGAAVAQRYALAQPHRVARLTLVVPPGLPEPWWMPCHPVREAAKLICSLPAPLLPARASSLLRVIRTTPQYGVDPRKVVALARDGKFKLAVYAAQLDVVHSPHAQFWRAAAGCCGGHASGRESVGKSEGKSEGTSAGSSVGRVPGRRKHSKCDPASGESCRAAQAEGFVHGWYGAFDDDDSGDADGSRHEHGGPAAPSSPSTSATAAVRFELLRGRSHWGVATHLFELGLHLVQELWHEEPADETEPRMRLGVADGDELERNMASDGRCASVPKLVPKAVAASEARAGGSRPQSEAPAAVPSTRGGEGGGEEGGGGDGPQHALPARGFAAMRAQSKL